MSCLHLTGEACRRCRVEAIERKLKERSPFERVRDWVFCQMGLHGEWIPSDRGLFYPVCCRCRRLMPLRLGRPE